MFARTLKLLRNKKNKTQKEISKALGVAPTTYASWEQGKREPDQSSTERLADYFNVSIDYLYGRNETPPWATQKDSIDLKSFLDGNMNPNMNYDGEDLTTEQNERLKLAMTQIFWEERQKDKKSAENHGNDKGIK